VSEKNKREEGRCLFCGTARPVNQAFCPTCGRPWIDTRAGEDLPASTPAPPAAATEPTGESSPPVAEPPPATGGYRRLALGIALGIVFTYALVFVFLLNSRGGEAPTALPSATTTAGSVAPTTTTAPPTTTTMPTTTTPSTTTTTTTTIPPIEAVGDPIPIGDLSLGAFAIGSLNFGDDDALGRLVASLGQPDRVETAGPDLGLCPTEAGIAVGWGGFTAIFRTNRDLNALVGYRLDQVDRPHPTDQMATKSGLQLGDTLLDLNQIYVASQTAVVTIDGSPFFLLLRSTDDRTLLWGPLTSSAADGVVMGIYSPRPCDGGPKPSP